ncbi:phosphotransferase [Bacillus sp. CGMCC 1.16607]|uniref:phosphotransferase n=1 Tax=Bacillus sp. CGMCC 1.16607 TaxID=3351842 RepID=UPI003627D11E
MSQAWSPEIVVTMDEARHLIEAQFPELAPVNIQELGKGFDNTVFKVNDDYVFRFPRKEIAVRLLNTENQLLPNLVNGLNIRIPEPIFFGKETDSYNWPFTGYHLVKGTSPGQLSADIRNKSAAPLAHFLRKLHQFPIEMAEKLGVPYDWLERTNIGKRMNPLIDNIKKAIQLQLIDEAETAFHWLDSIKDVHLDEQQTLVHGDCHIRNILVDEIGVISGIIDWGDTHLGHPAIDLSIAYSFLTLQGREQFFGIYGNVSETTKTCARFFALYVSVVLLLYGHDLQDAKLVASAKESIKLSLS